MVLGDKVETIAAEAVPAAIKRTPTSPMQSAEKKLPDDARRTWSSERLFAFALLAVAVAIGAYVRFHHLTLTSMNGDEGATWAAASAPSFGAVAVAEQRIEALGKLPVYHMLLHAWIGVFGDGLFAMRALSASLGTIAIVLLFAAVREVFLCLTEGQDVATAEVAAAFAALIFATNAAMVLQSRLIRMYPLVLSAEFLQILFFVRAQRYGLLRNYAGIAIFTALMVAANFSASFLLVAEAVWLAGVLIAGWMGAPVGGLRIFPPGFAVLAGLGLLAPILIGVVPMSASAVESGWLNFIRLRPIRWTYTVFRGSVGGAPLFEALLVLAALGVLRQWRSAGLAVNFLGAWTVGPMLGMLAATYLIHPLEVMRYVLIAFVGLFVLAALGAASFRSTYVRVALAALLIAFSIRPLHGVFSHRGVDWHKAIALAMKLAAPDKRIAVVPAYEIDVARYYLSPGLRDRAVGLDGCGPERVAIFTGWSWLPAQETAKVDACYPNVVGHLSGAQVRSR